jgi:hypothetical protein
MLKLVRPAYSEICLLVKSYNEIDFEDWLRHYTSLKADKITIFDNESSINVRKIVKKVDNNRVAVREIKGFPNQSRLYTNYCKESDSRWVFFVDDDEFLYLNNKANDINSLLCNYEKYSGLCFNWLFMSYDKPIVDRPVPSCIDYCLYSSDRKNSLNSHVKTFVNPKMVRGYGDPHLPAFRSGFAVNFDYKRCKRPVFERFTDSVILFHYYLKSKLDWEEKRKRGRATTLSVRISAYEKIVNFRLCKNFDTRMMEYKKRWGQFTPDSLNWRDLSITGRQNIDSPNPIRKMI